MGNSSSLSVIGTTVAVAAAAAYAWEAWSYASSRPSTPTDSHGPKEPANTAAHIELQMLLQELVVEDDGVDQILPDPEPDQINAEAGGGSRAPRRTPLPYEDRGIIKILTYNIWCVEDVRLQERMQAIHKLIQEHTPDIILLQEITPMIYEIFQKFSWWGLYKCSVRPDKATRKFFCMLLSKLPVEKFYIKRFEHATNGKGLCVGKIITRKNKKLVVATCHLKRPIPSETNSTERVSQAKEALNSFESAPNVVIGGDMNWDEDFDGPFPLPGEWDDAWTNLRPGQGGWTYDTESNEMLQHSRTLQKRLDRFICKLKDFDMVQINIIGKEPIPGVLYASKRTMLPVLPSDHYGLMLIIMPKQ